MPHTASRSYQLAVTDLDKLLQELEALLPSRIFVLVSRARDNKTGRVLRAPLIPREIPPAG